MSEYIPFRNDISLCTGSDVKLFQNGKTEICHCPIRETCLRYLMYQDTKKPNEVWHIMPLDCINNENELYIEHKKIKEENT